MNQLSDLYEKFNQQKKHFQQTPNPNINYRINQLKKLKQAILTHQDELLSALSTDYNYRSKNEGLISEIMPIITNINYTLKHLKKWLKPSKRNPGLLLYPAKVTVHYQPIGVVGIIVPWNFPVQLSFSPLIGIIAAGNTAMLKLSEFTPSTNHVISKLLASVFSETQVTTIEGEADISAQFSALPFDHLLFTGSTAIGKQVMKAAANNLTPVTLELGGKSPVIIAQDMPIDIAVERMIYGKCLNAGQICVAPDYVLCHEAQIEAFINAYQACFSRLYGEVKDNLDYSNIINQQQFDRLKILLDDAVNKGAKVHSASIETLDKNSRKLATQLITNTHDDMLIMQQEIFGPLLPIISYQNIQQAIDYVNQRPRPLALYLMSFDKNIHHKVLTQTHSGGVCINETLMHLAANDAPFGGIGASGIGHYHGKEGFLRFSHAKTVLSRGHINTGKLVHPPYDKWWQKLLFTLFIR